MVAGPGREDVDAVAGTHVVGTKKGKVWSASGFPISNSAKNIDRRRRVTMAGRSGALVLAE